MALPTGDGGGGALATRQTDSLSVTVDGVFNPHLARRSSERRGIMYNEEFPPREFPPYEEDIPPPPMARGHAPFRGRHASRRGRMAPRGYRPPPRPYHPEYPPRRYNPADVDYIDHPDYMEFPRERAPYPPPYPEEEDPAFMEPGYRDRAMYEFRRGGEDPYMGGPHRMMPEDRRFMEERYMSPPPYARERPEMYPEGVVELPEEYMNIDDLWIETLAPNGRPYYYNAKTRQALWERPEGGKLLNREQISNLAATTGMTDPQAMAGAAPADGMFVTDSPNGATPAMYCVPADPNMTEAQQYAAYAQQFAAAAGYQATPMEPGANPPEANGVKYTPEQMWSIHYTEEGMKYYFNWVTNVSTWEKPEGIDEPPPPGEKPELPPQPAPEPDAPEIKKENDEGALQPPGTGEAPPAPKPEPVKEEEKPAPPPDDGKEKPANDVKAEPAESKEAEPKVNNKTEEVEKAAEKKEKKAEPAEKPAKSEGSNKCRPVSSTPITGTPWCVVWTGDNRVFYYNASENRSCWGRPKDLQNREDIDKIIAKRKKKKADSSDSDSAPEAKKVKKEEDGECTSPDKTDGGSTPEQPDSKQDPRKSLPMAEREKMFRELLDEKQVSTTSTWEKELHKIVFDSRYTLLTSRERKDVFHVYVKDKIQEEKMKRKMRHREMKHSFKKLLEEAGVTPKSRFGDFSERYGNDERFKAIEKTRDKEDLFDDYLRDLRRKERNAHHKESSSRPEKNFLRLLKEQKSISGGSEWRDIKEKISSDDRYKGIDDDLRRKLFEEYVTKVGIKERAKEEAKRD